MASKKGHMHVDFCITKPYFCSLWSFMDAQEMSPELVASFAFLMKDLKDDKEFMQAHLWQQETFDGHSESDGYGGRPKEKWPARVQVSPPEAFDVITEAFDVTTEASGATT